MKRFITLLLMVTILVTFTQKAAAFAPQSESVMNSMVDCPMSDEPAGSPLAMGTMDCADDQVAHAMNCQGDCGFMTVPAVLYFSDIYQNIYQPQLQLTYSTGNIASPYYFPESLYRPPFIS